MRNIFHQYLWDANFHILKDFFIELDGYKGEYLNSSKITRQENGRNIRGNFLNVESCSEIDFQTYQFSSDVFVLCCVKWQSCAPGHRCRANINVSLDFAWQQLCPQPRRFQYQPLLPGARLSCAAEEDAHAGSFSVGWAFTQALWTKTPDLQEQV